MMIGLLYGHFSRSAIQSVAGEALMETYALVNGDQNIRLSSADNQGIAQSFTGNGAKITRCVVNMRAFGTITGNIVAKIYAISGTSGTDSVPTGSALATSDTIDVTTIASGVNQNYTFNFSGANQFQTVNGTNYSLSIEYSGGDASNNVGVVVDASSPTDDGNNSTLVSSVWSAITTQDLCFELYGF